MSDADAIARQIQTAKEIGALQEGQRNLQRADELHETHMQRMESKIDAVQALVAEKVESLREEMRTLAASSAGNAAERAIQRFLEVTNGNGPAINWGAVGATAKSPYVFGPVVSGFTLAVVVVLKKFGIDFG